MPLDDAKGEEEGSEEQQPAEKRRRLAMAANAISQRPTRGERPLVCEAFSKPCLAEHARRKGKLGGWSLEFCSECPTTGRRWNLASSRDIRAARKLLKESCPVVLRLSPPCTASGASAATWNYNRHLMKSHPADETSGETRRHVDSRAPEVKQVMVVAGGSGCNGGREINGAMGML